ncbi:MAG TPA: PPOX class F420-dependent oxidoreductase [Mycobacteriales bacterium]|jgi:PPOX class probable F420-dependent enzyme|nr:PPOX class F420-dependent oxidoreductase [Mycobacteriales bacterium]
MDLDLAREFIESNHHAVLATYRADGRPQMSPVSVAIDGDGFAVVSTREPAMKTRNVRRDPRVSLCVLTDDFYSGWVYVDGRADVVTLPEAMEPLIDYYRRISGEHPDWADYRAAMERDHRVLLRITLEHAGPNVSG